MIHHTDDLRRAVLALPVGDRADLAAQLLASLDDPSDGDAAEIAHAWDREIERRALRVLSDESDGEPWADVRARRPSRR